MFIECCEGMLMSIVGAKVMFKEGLCLDPDFDDVVGEVIEVDVFGNLYVRFVNSSDDIYDVFECDADESELIFLTNEVVM